MLLGNQEQRGGTESEHTNWWGTVYYNYGSVKKDLGDLATAERYWWKARDKMARKVRYLVDYSLGSAYLQSGDVYAGLYHFNTAHAFAPTHVQQRMGTELMSQTQKFKVCVCLS